MMSGSDISTFTSTLNLCLQRIQELEKNYANHTVFILQFKRFLKCLSNCLTEIKSNAVLSHNQIYKSKIQLCLSQISKVLALLGSVINRPPCRQIVWYLCGRLRWCVSEICRVLSGSVTDEDCYYDSSDSFLHRIDLALELLGTHGTIVPPSWKQLVDDLIYQAVTIAKIASHIDYNEITSACHKLLEESTQFEGERQDNPPQLLRDSLSVSLASLERRVNTAILRLFLQVFSEPNKPLKQLVRCCGKASQSRSTADLDDLVTELDAHTERIILIGQFAVSCCEDTNRVAGIRCCLASIESVDNYLVPALSAFYLSPNCQDKQDLVRFLCEHWQDELALLHTLLDAIIDSYAFSRIVQESMNDLSDRLCEGESAKEISQQGWLLYKHLSKIHDSSLENDCLARLKQAVHEYEAAVSKQASLSAILKRVGRVTAAVDSVSEQLAASISAPSHPDHVPGSPEIIGSLKDLPLDISFKSISNSQHGSCRPQWSQKKNLEEKDNKQQNVFNITKVLRSRNTVLAVENPMISPRTPTNVTNSMLKIPKSTVKSDANLLTPYLSKTAERNTTLYVRTPRKVIQSHVMDNTFTDNTDSSDSTWDSLALEITDILESLSTLTDTLSSTKGNDSIWSQVKPTPPADVMKQYFSGTSFDSKWFSLASVRTDEVSDVNTPERLQDLKELDEKIKTLKLL